MSKDIEVKVKVNVDKGELEEFKKFLDDIVDVNVDVGVNVEDEELDESMQRLDEFDALLDEIYPDIDIDVDYSDVDDATDSIKEVEKATDDAKNSNSELTDSTDGVQSTYVDLSSAIHDVIDTFEAIISEIWAYVDAAGTIEDTNNRIADMFGKMGVEGLDTTKELISNVSSLSKELAITKGGVKSVFDNFSHLGATDKNIKPLTQGLEALAFVMGKNVPEASKTMANIVSRDSIRLNAENKRILTEMSVATGKTTDEIKAEWKNLTVDQRRELIEQIGLSESGQKSAEKYADSWMNTKDKLDAIWSRIEQDIGKVFKPLVESIIPVIEYIIWLKDEFNKLTGDAGNYIMAFILIAGGVVALATGIIIVIGLLTTLGTTLVTISLLVTLVVLAIVALGLALMWLYQNSAAFREFIDAMYGALVKIKTDLGEVFKPLIDSWNEFMNAIGGGDSGTGLGMIMEMLKYVGEAFIQYLLFPLRYIIGVVVPLITFILDLITILVQLATGQITLQEAVNQAWEAIKKLIMSVFRNIVNAIPTFIKNIVDYFKQLPAKIMEAIKGLKDQFLNFFKDLANQAWSAITSIFDGGSEGDGSEGDINEHLKSGFALTSTQIINQYGFLDMDGGMDAVEKLNKGIDRRNDLRMV